MRMPPAQNSHPSFWVFLETSSMVTTGYLRTDDWGDHRSRCSVFFAGFPRFGFERLLMTHRWSPDAGKIEIHSMPIAPDKIDRAAMSAFCQSLAPEDWFALEQLSTRVRNALLKQTIAVALRWRSRRTRRTRK